MKKSQHSKSFVALLLLAAMFCVFLAGCSNSTTTADNTENTGDTTETSSNDASSIDKSITIGTAIDIESLNPYSNIYPERFSILALVYQPLVLNVDNVFYNILITDYEQTDDYTFVLHLRDNVYDSAGNHFTASDVVYSYKIAQESGFFTKIDDTESITALDDYSVEIRFKDTMLYGEIDLITTQVFMVTEAAYSASPDGMLSAPVGTGCCVVDEYVEGSYVVLKTNKDYWNTAVEGDSDFVPYYNINTLDTIRYDFITDASSRAIALESGSIDIANKLDYVDYCSYEGSSDVTTYWRTGEVYDAIYNCDENHPLNNINMRLAISYCLDIDGLIEGAFDGQAEANKGMNNVYHTDCDPARGEDSFEYFDYNLDYAKECLQKYFDETGTTAAETTITIMVMNLEELQRVAEIWQTYINALGIKCELAVYDSVTRKTIRNSRDGWDIAVAKDTAIDLYNCDKLNMQWNRTTGKSMAGGWIDDDELDELMRAAVAPSTHSIETMGAFDDYVYEMCYARSLAIDRVYSASVNWIEKADWVYDYTSPLASVYNWSAK